eukprot:CAMPEP_0118982640 /NCGR_PEP_ID=MMETSP1173-20130426/33290_1 /TAXON_ID=1034831 /ORGANISM="Rhizochromulina marina cf, Strain CCMP1243" /LENGTH=84 /DNA_ID=CAMNT_0006933147 /DNA_START=35 /DNA_END=286 /DNA_ORIENTATION=+
MAMVPKDDVLGAFSFTIDLTGDLPTGFSCFALPSALYLATAEGDHHDFLWYSAVVFLVLGGVLMTICPIVDTVTFIEACTSDDG